MNKMIFRLISGLLFVFAGVTQVSAYPVTGLLAAYHFDAGDGQDSSGNNYDMTTFGGTAFNPDDGSGLAPSFTSRDTYLQTNNTNLNGGWSGMTASAWIKREGLSTYGNVLDNGNSSDVTGIYVLSAGGTYAGSPVYTRFAVAGTAVTSTNSLSTTFNPGDWHMLTGTYDGTTVNLYIDGILDTTAVATSPGALVGIGSAGSVTKIGGSAPRPHWYDKYFPGQIDDVLIYNRALGAAEVLALVDSSKIAEVPEPAGIFILMMGILALGRQKLAGSRQF